MISRTTLGGWILRGLRMFLTRLASLPVRVETRHVIDTLGKDHGFMLSSVHTIKHDVRPENNLVMVGEAIR
jgi:hypothetical protein